MRRKVPILLGNPRVLRFPFARPVIPSLGFVTHKIRTLILTSILRIQCKDKRKGRREEKKESKERTKKGRQEAKKEEKPLVGPFETRFPGFMLQDSQLLTSKRSYVGIHMHVQVHTPHTNTYTHTF